MIKNFHINNVATFDSSGVRFEDLTEVNFIYGSNGSGKTTISKSLNRYNQNCSIDWLANNPLNIYVYNKIFKENNMSSTNIDGIFTLGEEDVENEKLIKQAKVDIELSLINKEKYQKDLLIKKEELETLISSKEEEVWNNIEFKNDPLFKKALKGFRKSKPSFFDKNLREMNNGSNLLTLDELKVKAKSIFDTNPTSINQITLIPNQLLLSIETHSIWQENIIGKGDVDIAELIERLNISDWVNTGMHYIQPDSTKCPFCQKNTIDKDFRENIENYFDDSYMRKKSQVETLKTKYIDNSAQLVSIIQDVIDSHKAPKNYNFDCVLFEQTVSALKEKVSHNENIIEDKNLEPSRTLELKATSSEIVQLNKIIEEANIEIQSHNELVRTLKNSTEQFKAELWRLIIEENKPLLNSYLKTKKGIDAAISSLTSKVGDMTKKISKLEKEIEQRSALQTATDKTVTEINKTLKSFGFEGFSIQSTNDNKYQLRRKDGSFAHETLSEGEVSFITFLYFYHLCTGSTNAKTITNNRVIVIDDPISSLDSNILFIVSSLVKDIIHKIKNDDNFPVKQLITLTHNIYFHKEASFISGKFQERAHVKFWILKKTNEISTVQSHGPINPISSSYELLWRELEQPNISSISLQNSMRRIIENYFRIYGGIQDEDIYSQFDDPQEKMVCRSLICWINDGSHCIPDDLYIEDQFSSTNEYRSVFKAIFEKTGHLSHYEMMMRDRTVTI